MANNTDFNLHRTIINGLLAISLENRLCLCAFRNLIKHEIERFNNDLIRIPNHNIFRNRIEIRISLLQLLIVWLDLRIALLLNIQL